MENKKHIIVFASLLLLAALGVQAYFIYKLDKTTNILFSSLVQDVDFTKALIIDQCGPVAENCPEILATFKKYNVQISTSTLKQSPQAQ